MKRTVAIVFALIVSLSYAAYGIGLQHGLFRSQSTQGDPWQGTATIVEEHYDITVYPDYLDVELTWVFEAGGTEPASYTDALEIVGNLNFVDNSVVVGMITWYKDMVLKGKLKTNEVAREQYEDVVDRSSDAPPPPRDPVLLEWIRDDNYDISIFPVSFGGTRKVRIRYLIPAFSLGGTNRIAWPHAFTDNATVSVSKGAGVSAWRLETSRTPRLFDTPGPVQLSTDEFQFTAYGSSRSLQTITAIVPVLDEEHDGSTMYVGAFSSPSMSGEMAHVVTMSADKALLRSDIAVDYVILWRWNHPEILAKHAGEIVAQSKSLKKFLESLDAENKRAALIVDRQGGERTTFRLDKPGGSEYTRLIAWLNELASREVVEPQYGTSEKKPDITYDVQAAFRQFQEALEAVQALFEDDTPALRRLLVLTAGPRLVASGSGNTIQSWDCSIAVSLFSSYINSSGSSDMLSTGLTDAYWPGVDLLGFVSTYGGQLTVEATVGNGKQSLTLPTSSSRPENCYYCGHTGVTDAHLYSADALERTITWSVMDGEGQVARFVETPRVVIMSEGMQYARLLGSSKYLHSLADEMPSSIASTLGFIDEKYALVALEEDALPDATAKLYEKRGVPPLEPGDIFPAADEVAAMPVAQWLESNPPDTIKSGYGYYPWIRAVPMVDDTAWFMDGAVKNNMDEAGEPGRIATPQVEPITELAGEPEPDYSEALAARPGDVPATEGAAPVVRVKSGTIVIDLSHLGAAERIGARLMLYDLSGRLLASWSDIRPDSGGKVMISTAADGFARGSYLLRIQLGTGRKVTYRVALR